MDNQILTRRHADASVMAPVSIEAVASSAVPTVLYFNQHTSWAARTGGRAITSGIHQFRPDRFEGEVTRA